jgi:hypothetical protein
MLFYGDSLKDEVCVKCGFQRYAHLTFEDTTDHTKTTSDVSGSDDLDQRQNRKHKRRMLARRRRRKKRKRQKKNGDKHVVRYWPIEKWLRVLWEDPLLAKAMHYAADREAIEGFIMDVLDATNWEDFQTAFGAHAHATGVGMTGDAADVNVILCCFSVVAVTCNTLFLPFRWQKIIQ